MIFEPSNYSLCGYYQKQIFATFKIAQSKLHAEIFEFFELCRLLFIFKAEVLLKSKKFLSYSCFTDILKIVILTSENKQVLIKTKGTQTTHESMEMK